MPISKGEPWGHRGPVPAGVVSCADDAAVADAVWAATQRGGSAFVSVRTGDLLRTVGGTQGGSNDSSIEVGADALLLPMDLCVARCDDGEAKPFVAHLVAHRRWWQGNAAVAMNAGWLGEWYLGPRAHPNDGLIDTTAGSLPLRQRVEAGRRAKLGNHLPHPALTTSRRQTWSHDLGQSTPVFLDGVARPKARRISVEVVPDVFTLVLP